MLNPVVRIATINSRRSRATRFPTPDCNIAVHARDDLPPGRDISVQGKNDFTLYRSGEWVSRGNYEPGAKIGYAFGRYEAAVFARDITKTKNLVDVINTSNYRAGIL